MMGRIRTIKPDFPHSETVGRLSRDARLLFVQLWTIVDDSGRARASSRMLASLLYPYDDDARGLIDGWLAELAREKCIVRYVVAGSEYLEVCNWLKHQKIDRPSQSKIPAFDESSRALDEPSTTDKEEEEDREGNTLKGRENAPPEVSPPSPPATVIETPDARLYRRGREVLGKSSGGMIRKLIAAKGGSIAQAHAAIETASEKADPAEYIGAIIHSRNRPRSADELRLAGEAW